ncbi:MAG: protein GumC [Deltaproteobacteria bacterium RIFOXYC2_FULL_48_10]|nr:MAG: protein GumC [Deltaproteobacteria bacterium RIFOXYC2_FULL_48_10]
MADQFQSQMPIKPDQILEIIIRRRWFILIPFCITLTLGLFHTLTAGKTYEASTLILVQPQRVPSNYVRSVVTSTINERISTISQQILSRSNLEKIIDQFGLFANAKGMYLEDQVAALRKRVRVKIERTRSDAEAFSIVFQGDEPQTVMRIANTLASFFMDENLKVREAQAVGTSEFLDSELEKTRKTLEEREKQLAEYRSQYMGGLPDELETNLRTLDRLQQQLTIKNETLAQARNSLSLLQAQIAQSNEMASQSMTDPFSMDFGEDSLGSSEDEQKLAAAQREYENLLLKYTDKHPDARKLKTIIEKLEKSIEENKAKAAAEAEANPKTSDPNDIATQMPNFAAMQQGAQIKQAKAGIQKIESDIAILEQRMKEIQTSVEDTPKRELELQSLQRDYSNIQSVFNSLLDRKLEAELSVNMEKKQKGEQFRILDHARLPERPISPNVKLLFLLSIASGIGIGAGLIFLLEIFDSSIRREEQIEKDLGLKILAAIPPMKWPQDRAKRKIELIAFACFSVYAVIFFSFFAILNYKGLDRTINFIKSTLNI